MLRNDLCFSILWSTFTDLKWVGPIQIHQHEWPSVKKTKMHWISISSRYFRENDMFEPSQEYDIRYAKIKIHDHLDTIPSSAGYRTDDSARCGSAVEDEAFVNGNCLSASSCSSGRRITETCLSLGTFSCPSEEPVFCSGMSDFCCSSRSRRGRAPRGLNGSARTFRTGRSS